MINCALAGADVVDCAVSARSPTLAFTSTPASTTSTPALAPTSTPTPASTTSILFPPPQVDSMSGMTSQPSMGAFVASLQVPAAADCSLLAAAGHRAGHRLQSGRYLQVLLLLGADQDSVCSLRVHQDHEVRPVFSVTSIPGLATRTSTCTRYLEASTLTYSSRLTGTLQYSTSTRLFHDQHFDKN